MSIESVIPPNHLSSPSPPAFNLSQHQGLFSFRLYMANISSRRKYEDFPSGTVDKNPPCNTGDMGSIPGPGGFHMPQSNKAHVPRLLTCTLEPWSCNWWGHILQVLKPAHLKPVLHQHIWWPVHHQNEKQHTTMKISPWPPQLEKAGAKQWRSSAAKSKF